MRMGLPPSRFGNSCDRAGWLFLDDMKTGVLAAANERTVNPVNLATNGALSGPHRGS